MYYSLIEEPEDPQSIFLGVMRGPLMLMGGQQCSVSYFQKVINYYY